MRKKEKNELIAQYLRLLRESTDHTQEEMAALLGITRQTYSHYENARLTPQPARSIK